MSIAERRTAFYAEKKKITDTTRAALVRVLEREDSTSEEILEAAKLILPMLEQMTP